AVLMINNVPGEPIPMGGTDNTITIPALMISQEDGMLIKDSLNTESTVNVTMMPVPLITPDGDFDNGIIVHEFGHGVSVRLTGGPSTASCLINDEQMGEGWSDFFGLMLTTDWSTAMPTDKRGIGTYSIGSPIDGTGIRTYPYTTDLAVNPFTYADVADAPIIQGQVSPHFVGSVWATMLWEMTWKIIEITAADPDMYHGNGGNNVALQLVMDGLKLQPCYPGFEEGRDAILLADELLYGGKYKCAIWEAFSKRGLGVSAKQNDSNSHTDGVEAFDLPSGVRIEHSVAEPVGEGTEVVIDVNAICECIDKTNIKIRDILPPSLEFIGSNQGSLEGDSVCFDVPVLDAQDTAFLSFTALVLPCQVLSGSTVSMDDAEGPDQYTPSKLAGTGNKNWVKNSALSNSPSNSWYAQDYNSLADIVITLDNPVTDVGQIDVGFYHRYETEASFDGGVVELSIDNGATWFDAGPYFTLNGYPSTISTAFTDSPIAGQPAFTGTSDDQFETNDFVLSKLTYCLGNQQTLLIRFRFVCDGSVPGTGIDGWYVDDITIKRKASLIIESQTEISALPFDTTLACLEVHLFDGSSAFVDPAASGVGSGETWEDALTDLAPAFLLAGCRSIDSIFVAEGLYYPTDGTDPLISFFIPDSTVVYGGFSSGGGSLDPEVHLSVMSGDIGLQGIHSDNTHYVLKIEAGQRGIELHGMQIKDANPSGAIMGTSGAPLFADGEILLEQVTIVDTP
ncbi:MAG: M36 family metallopeptidase, partial [Saprospiraceae bacterium]|nr:M36 family metallopeptidase [Saprospiraceae bacterium]